MADVIKYFKIDILAEHVRPFDSIVKGNEKYLFVPKSKCTDLTNKLFEKFLTNYKKIFKYYSLIKQSDFILYLFNLKLEEWSTKEEHILKCDLDMIIKFIRPFNYKRKKNTICGNVDDNYLIEKLINEIQNGAIKVKSYIVQYASNEFLKNFNAKLYEWFQSEDNVVNCEWNVLDYFIRPNSFTFKNDQIGTIEIYIRKCGCEQFINSFNEKLAELFQSEKSIANCELPMIHYFIRPKSFTIKNGQIGSAVNDDWLIQRLIDILMKSESSKNRFDDSTKIIERYIRKYGCEQFINSFNEKLAERFQSEKSVANCNWSLIHYFIRPKSFTIKNEQPTNVYPVKSYIRNYGSYEFVTHFNERLKDKVEIHDVVDQNCKWECLELFFDNVASSEASDIDNIFEDFDIDIEDVSDLDSCISIDTNNIESDTKIDVDSSNHSEGSDTENNNDNNGVLVMME
ncbi:unnamed protein product [Mytilus edulis]|uniref:Uncharacterized protein n=1 Tax=Mytilus edulis TaxID=6550 RepID=A0A8S3UMF4_MYTED|nr:unnamed protein product [Mytilus edulis]